MGSGETSSSSENDDKIYNQLGGNSEDNGNSSHFKKNKSSYRKYRHYRKTKSLRNVETPQGKYIYNPILMHIYKQFDYPEFIIILSCLLIFFVFSS